MGSKDDTRTFSKLCESGALQALLYLMLTMMLTIVLQPASQHYCSYGAQPCHWLVKLDACLNVLVAGQTAMPTSSKGFVGMGLSSWSSQGSVPVTTLPSSSGCGISLQQPKVQEVQQPCLHG
jgi:hypothetical protein